MAAAGALGGAAARAQRAAAARAADGRRVRVRAGWPRLGRWAVQPRARSGLLLHALPTADE